MVSIVRNTCEDWNNDTSVIAADVIAYDTTHNRVKIGNGINAWKDLPFIDERYNGADIREILDQIINQMLPLKADADNVYTKDEINNRNFVSRYDLLSLNYMNKDEAFLNFLTRGEADNLVELKELQAFDYATNKSVAEKANKEDVYTKGEIDRKLANIELHDICHPFPHPKPWDKPLHHSVPPCPPVPPEEPDEDEITRLLETIYVKGEVDALLLKKADKRFVNEALGLKADQSYVDSKLETDYYTIEEIDKIVKELSGEDFSNLATKEDLEDLSKELTDDYTNAITTAKEELNTKIETMTGVNPDEIVTKTDVEEALETKADKETVEESLALKADMTTVEEELELKADAANVYDMTTMDEKLALKADAETVYTKAEVDDLVTVKADSATTLAGYGIVDAYTQEQIDAKLESIATDASTAKQVAYDNRDDMVKGYATKEDVETDIKRLEDEIAAIGTKLTKLISVLMTNGCIKSADMGD